MSNSILPDNDALSTRTLKALLDDTPARLRRRVAGMGLARRRELADAMRDMARRSLAVANALDGATQAGDAASAAVEGAAPWQ